MPITRGFETILNEIDEKLERLSDDWERVHFKKRIGKREAFKRAMKKKNGPDLESHSETAMVSRYVGPSSRGVWERS